MKKKTYTQIGNLSFLLNSFMVTETLLAFLDEFPPSAALRLHRLNFLYVS